LYVDGKLVINNSSNWQPGEMWFNMGSVERRGVVKGLEQGKEYSLEVRCWFKKDLRGSPFKSAGAIRIGALPVVEPAQAIADAVKIAQQADTTIVVVGLNEDFESEGYDRKHME
jgi:beta-glucosidase